MIGRVNFFKYNWLQNNCLQYLIFFGIFFIFYFSSIILSEDELSLTSDSNDELWPYDSSVAVNSPFYWTNEQNDEPISRSMDDSVSRQRPILKEIERLQVKK